MRVVLLYRLFYWFDVGVLTENNYFCKRTKKEKIMQYTVDVINKNALLLLDDMVKMQFIRMRPTVAPPKLSEKFAGKLHLSDKEYDDFHSYLKSSRNEYLS